MNKLYKIWQDKNNNYDTFDSAIVCAENEEEAIKNLERALSEYLNISAEDKRLFPRAVTGSGDELMPTRAFGTWTKNIVKLIVAEKKLRKVFSEYKKAVK